MSLIQSRALVGGNSLEYVHCVLQCMVFELLGFDGKEVCASSIEFGAQVFCQANVESSASVDRDDCAVRLLHFRFSQVSIFDACATLGVSIGVGNKRIPQELAKREQI